VASLSQGRTVAAQCGLFTHKSVPVIFEPPCTLTMTLDRSVFFLPFIVILQRQMLAMWTTISFFSVLIPQLQSQQKENFLTRWFEHAIFHVIFVNVFVTHRQLYAVSYEGQSKHRRCPIRTLSLFIRKQPV